MERNEIAKKLRLQLITRRTTAEEILAEVEAFLEGGGRWVQLRMKEATDEEVTETGKRLLPLCREYGAVFLLNDRPELAAKIGADGVHIGKNDISATKARAILGKNKIVGATANTFEDIEYLNGFAIDYIGLGPFRFTTTKKNLSPVLGTEGYHRIFAQMREHGITIPVTVIGGITLEDIENLKEAGATCFAVSGAISCAVDPGQMTEAFLEKIMAPAQGEIPHNG